ncbi:BRO-N domain-containing protein [Enterobacter hormaechei]|uniref:BRO-N domain-containing protein n=1 Tax=Enterobacter hormaechei TaxID=158836 RepID=UPI0007AB531A|nr:BRO family protein [Enterobacter hormaechei]
MAKRFTSSSLRGADGKQREVNMGSELTFQDRTVVPFDNGDGKIWFTTDALADLLGYANANKVSNIYNRHKDEFTDSMTTVTKVRKDGINNSLREVEMRIFSPRGAHLIGMVSRTKVAKDLRIWMLDLVEKESGIQIAPLNVSGLAKLTGQQIHDQIASFDDLSFKHRGQKGSGLLAQRKKDKKRVKEATLLALQLTQFSIPDLGEFSEGLPV